MAGTPSTFFVDTVSVEKMTGGRGKMTVTLSPTPQPDFGSGDSGAVYEIEWSEVQRKIEQHPVFGAGGAWELTDIDRDKVMEWQNATTSKERARIYSQVSFTANARQLADRIRDGQETYLIFTPIVRLTTTHATQPTTGGCGVISAPPGIAPTRPTTPPSPYIWVKTADRLNLVKVWTRVQEWTGADVWDAVLYT